MAALGYGISFTMASLGRVTNSMFICILTLNIIFDMILEKKWLELAKSAVLFILGFSCSLAPFLIYFASQNELPAMIEASFTFSFSYAVESSFLESVLAIRWPIMITFLIETVFALKICWHEYKKRIFLLFNAVIMFATLNLGNAYIHYYQTLIPGMLAVFWLCWNHADYIKNFKKYLVVFLSFSVFINLIYFIPYSGRVIAATGVNTQERTLTPFGQFARKIEQFDSYGRGNYGYESQMYVDDILSKIPEQYRDSVYNYETNPYWLLLSDLKPYNKYCITADHFSCLSETISNDIKYMFETQKPKYIVTDTGVNIKNQMVKQYIMNDYICVYQNKIYTLWQQKEL